MKIIVERGDLTEKAVDAIVNAANSSLLGGGGVDGAIHRKAGPELREYNRGLGGCNTGEAKLSPGFQLPAKYVISTVGPVWGQPYEEKEKLLRSCYMNSLQLAMEKGFRTVAFPSISTGVYGYPVEKAAKVAMEAMREFRRAHPEAFTHVYMVNFSEADRAIYQRALDEAMEGECR